MCLGGTAGCGCGVLIGLTVARVNRAVIGWFSLCVRPVPEPSGDAAMAPLRSGVAVHGVCDREERAQCSVR